MVAAAGADAIGVNLWPGSKRHVTPDAARDILDAIPAGVLKVGVFVDAPADEVERQIDEAGTGPRAASRRRGRRDLRPAGFAH